MSSADGLHTVRKGRRLHVAVGVGCWPLVGPVIALLGATGYSMERLTHSLEGRRRRGDDAAIPIATLASFVAIPTITTMGSAVIGVGALKPMLTIPLAFIAVVMVCVFSWTVAIGVVDHGTRRRVIIWEPDATANDVRRGIEEAKEVLQTRWLPGLATAAAEEGVRRADDVPVGQLAGGDPDTPAASAHALWPQVGSTLASMWAGNVLLRAALFVSWAWAAVFAVWAAVGVVNGQLSASLVQAGYALILVVGLPLGGLATYAELESAYFLARVRQRVLEARTEANAPEVAAPEPARRVDALVAAVRTYRVARRRVPDNGVGSPHMRGLSDIVAHVGTRHAPSRLLGKDVHE